MGDHLWDMALDWLNCELHSEDEVNAHLTGHGFPPLQEWYMRPDEVGRYETARIENDSGLADKNGEYITDYDIEVQVLTIEPWKGGRES